MILHFTTSVATAAWRSPNGTLLVHVNQQGCDLIGLWWEPNDLELDDFEDGDFPRT